MTRRPPPLATSALEAPEIEWRDNRLASTRFADIYSGDTYTDEDARHVYLAGCNLPEEWTKEQKDEKTVSESPYTLAETGFGAGINMLTTAATWLEHTAAPRRLHLISVEAYPLDPATLAQAIAPLPSSLHWLGKRLLQNYPVRTAPGFERIWLADRVCLTLIFGLADVGLASLIAPTGVHAWLLDGFAPARNPDMWSAAVMNEVGRLSHLGTRASSFSVARMVRNGLSHEGFEVKKRSPHSKNWQGKKRETLTAIKTSEGTKTSSPLPPWFLPPQSNKTFHTSALMPPKCVTVIGAGLAGTCLTLALARRHIPVHWLTAPNTQTTSKVPHALLTPKIGCEVTPILSLYAACYRYGRRFYDEYAPNLVDYSGTWKSEDTDSIKRKAEALYHVGFDSQLNGSDLFLPDGGNTNGSALLNRLHLACAAYGYLPKSLPLTPQALCDLPTNEITPVVLCCGDGLKTLVPELPLSLHPGEMREVSISSRQPHPKIAKGAYLTNQIENTAWIGGGGKLAHNLLHALSNIDVANTDVANTEAEQTDDTLTLPRELGAHEVRATRAYWKGIRTTLPDRLPIAGPLPDPAAFATDYGKLRQNARLDERETLPAPRYLPERYVLGGLGSRGFVTAPLLAEFVASVITGDPWPLSAELATLILPARFQVRALKRRED